MNTIVLAVAKRFARAAVATAIPAAINWLNSSTDPTLMALTPAIMAAGKLLRDRYGWTWLPV